MVRRPGNLGLGYIHPVLGDFSGEGDCPDSGFPLYSVMVRNCSRTYDEPNPRDCCKCALHQEIMNLKKDSDDRYAVTGPKNPDAMMARRAKDLSNNLSKYNGWTDSNHWGRGCEYGTATELQQILNGVMLQNTAALTKEAAAFESRSTAKFAIQTATDLAQKKALIDVGKSASDSAATRATESSGWTAFKQEADVYGTAASQTGYDVLSLMSGGGWRPEGGEGPLGNRRSQVRTGKCDPGDIVCKLAGDKGYKRGDCNFLDISCRYKQNKMLMIGIAIAIVSVVLLVVLQPYVTVLSRVI